MFSRVSRTGNHGHALAKQIPRWLWVTLVLAIWLLVALGIYVGLHSRVLGPEY
jgi:hypothetical protein